MTAIPRRRVLGAGALGAAAVSLAACGSDSSSSSGASDGGADATRSVTDATDQEVKVPSKPKKVVVLHYAGAQAMLDLGVAPAGTAALGTVGGGSDATKFTTAEMWSKLKDIPTIDSADGVPDVEKVAELEPDLILATNALEDSVIAQMEDIAPTYQFLLRGGDRAKWWVRVEQIADALGIPEAYDSLHASWQEDLEKAAEEYKDVAEGLIVGVYDMYEEGNLYLWAEENMVGTVLSPLGVAWSAEENAAVENEDEAEVAVAVEKSLDVLGDANVLFYGTDMQNNANPLTAKYQKSDLYQQLQAVEDDRTFPFGKCTIAGFTDARYSLDQVTSALRSLRE